MLGEVSFMLFAYEMSMLCTDGKVTDLASYYTLPSTIIGNPQYDTLKAAFMYYTVAARTPLQQLMQDLLVLAHQKCALRLPVNQAMPHAQAWNALLDLLQGGLAPKPLPMPLLASCCKASSRAQGQATPCNPPRSHQVRRSGLA